MSSRASRTTTSAATSVLLVYKVRIDNGRTTLFVAVRQHTAQFTPSGGHAARNDQCGIAEVDDPTSPPCSIPHRRRKAAGKLVWPRCDTLAFAVAGTRCIVIYGVVQGGRREPHEDTLDEPGRSASTLRSS